MKAKFITTLLLATLVGPVSTKADSDWQLGSGFAVADFSDVDIELNIIYVEIGYRIETGDHFFLIPEVRFGKGIGDESIDVFGTNVDLEVDSFFAGGIRGQWESEDGFYAFGRVNYGDMELEASSGSLSESASDSEVGLGVGMGYYFSETIGGELSWEDYDGTSIISGGLNIKF